MAAFIVSWWYAARKKEDPLLIADCSMGSVFLGQGIGRIGCLLNGCCYGKEIHANIHLSSSCLLTFERIPAQAISSLSMFVLFGILEYLYHNRNLPKGAITVLYFLLYSFVRFCLEFIRADNPPVWGIFTLGGVLSAGMFFVSLIGVWIVLKQGKRREGRKLFS